MKYSINKYRNPPAPPEPHPLFAPIRRPAWTPVGTGRFPMQDISPLFSNWLQEKIMLGSPNIMPISNSKRGVTRRVGGGLEFLRPLVQTSFCGETPETNLETHVVHCCRPEQWLGTNGSFDDWLALAPIENHCHTI